MTEREVLRQIQTLTTDIIKTGLCDDQNFPVLINRTRRTKEVTLPGGVVNSFLKNWHYHEVYKIMLSERSFNLKMIDGALITMLYTFQNGLVSKHRLSFCPSPHLEEFQNNMDVYLEDEIYADIVDKRIVPFPMRFDYDSSASIPLEHPASHLTLGQYNNCRIPVSSALTPHVFLTFIISNFYNTAYKSYGDKLHRFDGEFFSESIVAIEREVLHINIPQSPNR